MASQFELQLRGPSVRMLFLLEQQEERRQIGILLPQLFDRGVTGRTNCDDPLGLVDPRLPVMNDTGGNAAHTAAASVPGEHSLFAAAKVRIIVMDRVITAPAQTPGAQLLRFAQTRHKSKRCREWAGHGTRRFWAIGSV